MSDPYLHRGCPYHVTPAQEAEAKARLAAELARQDAEATARAKQLAAQQSIQLETAKDKQS